MTATIYLLAGEGHRVIAVLSTVSGGVAALFLQAALDCLQVSCITVSVNGINWCTTIDKGIVLMNRLLFSFISEACLNSHDQIVDRFFSKFIREVNTYTYIECYIRLIE